MFKTLYPSKDATIYERIPVKNTGVDSILQLVKQTSISSVAASDIAAEELSGWNNTTNSRILIEFDYAALIATLAARPTSPPVKYLLKLFVANTAYLPYESTIQIHPLAQPWVNGTGFYRDTPSLTNGVNWYSASTSAAWSTGTLPNGTTGSWASIQGGGVWYTGSQYTTSSVYGYDSNTDLLFDVTSAVRAHLSGSLPNYGFLIKWENNQETSADTEGLISLYSRESYTVFLPKLIALWDDSDLSGTGSFTEVVGENNFSVQVKNLKTQYYEEEKPTLRLSIRDLYPTSLSYSASAYQDISKRLPVNSYYCITDSVTDSIILDYDIYNRIGCDARGNYIKLDINCLQPERYYYLSTKSEFTSGEVIYNQNIAFFKVSRI